MSNRDSIPEGVAAILPSTFLAGIARETVLRLLAGGTLVSLAPGTVLAHRPKNPGVALVIDGLVRVYLVSPQKREATVRYARPGETLGLAHLYGGKIDVDVQAVTATTLYSISPNRLRQVAEECSPLGAAIARECGALVASAIEELALLAFGSVRQLVARHLLDLAANDASANRLVAAVTQQELADATGSVREVIARVLKELNAAKVTARAKNGIAILDAARLDDEARGLISARSRLGDALLGDRADVVRVARSSPACVARSSPACVARSSPDCVAV